MMSPNPERNAEIIRRRLAGELPSDIRRAMGISRNIVAGVLDRAGVALGGHSDGCRKYANPPRGEACWKAKLTEAAVRAIRAEYTVGKSYYPGNGEKLAQEYGLSIRHLRRIANGHWWKHVA